MSPILVVLNMIALLFAIFVLLSLDKTFKRIFMIAMVLPIIIWFIVAFAGYPFAHWGFTEVIMMLLRGSFILGVFSGALACYIVTKLKQ